MLTFTHHGELPIPVQEYFFQDIRLLALAEDLRTRIPLFECYCQFNYHSSKQLLEGCLISELSDISLALVTSMRLDASRKRLRKLGSFDELSMNRLTSFLEKKVIQLSSEHRTEQIRLIHSSHGDEKTAEISYAFDGYWIEFSSGTQATDQSFFTVHYSKPEQARDSILSYFSRPAVPAQSCIDQRMN